MHLISSQRIYIAKRLLAGGGGGGGGMPPDPPKKLLAFDHLGLLSKQ